MVEFAKAIAFDMNSLILGRSFWMGGFGGGGGGGDAYGGAFVEKKPLGSSSLAFLFLVDPGRQNHHIARPS